MILNQTGYFGRGAIANIPAEIAARGRRAALIVTEPVLAENGTATRITDTAAQCKFVRVDPHDIPVIAVDAVAKLVVDLGNPTKTSEIGVDESGIQGLTDDAFADVCTPGNPRPRAVRTSRSFTIRSCESPIGRHSR